ncbi:MAG: ferrous iron transport protein A [Clostridiales bacterium]|nr:ferrous iron transport protein A [Clostridiales bacterium]
MPLIFGEPGKTYFIKKVSGNDSLRRRIEDMGFSCERPVTVVSNNCAGMIVRIKDTRVAVSRELAGRIMI